MYDMMTVVMINLAIIHLTPNQTLTYR